MDAGNEFPTGFPVRPAGRAPLFQGLELGTKAKRGSQARSQAGAAAASQIDATRQLEHAGKEPSSGCFGSPSLKPQPKPLGSEEALPERQRSPWHLRAAAAYRPSQVASLLRSAGIKKKIKFHL